MNLTEFVRRLTHRPQPSAPRARRGISPPLQLRRRQPGRTDVLAATSQADAAPLCGLASPHMPDAAVDPTDHRLIAGSRIRGVSVFSDEGGRWGVIQDLSIDKRSGRVLYALVAIEYAEAFGERIHPVPWSLLRYDHQAGGYRVPVDADLVPAGPGLSPAELEAFGAGHRASSTFDYNPILVMPFI